MIFTIKGVNHQVVEVTRPGCEYFERVVFFVKPEFSCVSDGTLRERAGMIADKAGAPPPSKLNTRSKLIEAAKIVAAAAFGAAVTAIVIMLIK